MSIKLYYKIGGQELPENDSNVPYTNLFADLASRLLVSHGYTLSADFKFEFNVLLDKNVQEGELKYVFKPFKNLRYSGNDVVIPDLLPGELTDFSTKKLNYSINYPVELEIQPSYDGTVNLIISDNNNPPRLVNSRFSVTEGRRFYIIDREGNKDTNIYDDDKLDSQTRLYKTINRIPKLEFLGIDNDGKFSVGNYVFYFRLVDADGNETDIITESGIVSCHIGNINDPQSIRGGMGNENSGKSLTFRISNLDSNYNFLNVYYSRSTSDYTEKEITQYAKINTKFSIKNTSIDLKLTGFEATTAITADKINTHYNIIDRNKTVAQAQNMLFLANIHKTTVPYRDLKDLSLRVLPFPEQEPNDIGYLLTDYTSQSGKFAYYDSKNVYTYTGYWDEEMYRLAIVYVMNDYSLSDPYSIRGRDFTDNPVKTVTSPYAGIYSEKELFNLKGDRVYIEEEDNKIVGSAFPLENTKGVLKIGGKSVGSQITTDEILPISIKVMIPDDVQVELRKYTKGFFLVRQKRIPTILCQGYSIGHDKASGLPLLPEYDNIKKKVNHTIQGVSIYGAAYNNKANTTPYSSVNAALTTESSQSYSSYLSKLTRLPLKGEMYFTFVNDDILDGGNVSTENSNFLWMGDHTDVTGTKVPKDTLLKNLNPGGALLVPDVVLNSEFLSQMFSGSDFVLTKTKFSPSTPGFLRAISANKFPTSKTLEQIDALATHFTIEGYAETTVRDVEKAKLVFVPEDTPSVSQDSIYYSSRAGIPEEAWRFSAFLKRELELVEGYIVIDNTQYTKESNVLIRGMFSPFVGSVGSIKKSGSFYNIRTLGYSEANVENYFKVRYEDNAPFMAISDRYDWERFNLEASIYSNAGYKSLNVYRGDCFINQASIRILRNFQDPEAPVNDIIIDVDTLDNFQGYGVADTDTLELRKENLEKINRGDVNAVRLGYWVTFKFCSDINFAFRCVNPTYTAEYALSGRPRAFYPLYSRNLAGSAKIADSGTMNVGFNSTTSDKQYFVHPDIPAIKNDYTNRIMYSEIHVNDAFKNGFRIFEGLSYQDYTVEFGTITKIISWFGNLIVVFESGVGIIPINERTMAGQSEGENIYLRNAGVLPEKPMMISHGIGSTWADSIRPSRNYIYGVDTVSKKIWRTDGKKFDTFSDFRVQKFLNDNISFTVYDKTPMIGLRNVVTHYNVFKNDVMFTFYDQTFNEPERVWHLCYNEQLNNWVTRFSWMPAFSENISNTFFTFARNTCKVTSMISKSIDSTDGIGSIYINSDGEYPLTVGDYLSLFYEKKLEDLVPIITTPTTVYKGVSLTGVTSITEANPVIFTDDEPGTSHPMYINPNGPYEYSNIWVFHPESNKVLLAYDKQNSPLLLSDNSTLSFYASSNQLNEISLGDTLLSIKKNNSLITDTIATTLDKPNLKIHFEVTAVENKTIADSLARQGWSFSIACLNYSISLLNTTEYFLTLQGKNMYNKTAGFSYSMDPSVNSTVYDNQYFEITNSPLSYLSINPQVFSPDTAEVKFNKILAFLDRIYFAFLVNLDVRLGDTTSKLSGTDKFEDSLYIRPSLKTLLDLKEIFRTLSTCPPLKPYVNVNSPLVSLTEQQRVTIVEKLTKTIERFKASTTTNLWKHGQSGIFEHEGEFLPAKWYGEQHPFEFEFVVNGDELGIHKMFDNLKIISNKAQPDSFEFEIVGDVYDFTEDYIDGKLSGGKMKATYELMLPAVQTEYAKTKEARILSVQIAKDFNQVGQRAGNMKYKEDMWEVQIQPLRVKKKSTGQITEAKIRDKYCKVKVKYTGTQLAIITALQTLYTLSYS